MWLYLGIYLLFITGSFFVINRSNRKDIVDFRGCSTVRRLRQNERIFLFLLCFMLLCISVFRYGLGSDYALYQRNYEGTAGYWELTDNRLLYALLNQLFHLFHLPFQSFIGFFAIYSLLLFQIIVKRYSWEQFLSYAMLVGQSYYSFSLSGFRQFAAIISLLFAVHMYYKDGKLSWNNWKWLIFLGIAVGVHLSSLFGVVLIVLLIKWNPKPKTVFILNICGIFTLIATRIFLGRINSLIAFLVGRMGAYSGYLNYANSAEQYYRLFSQSGTALFNLLLLLPSLFFCYEIFKDNNIGSFKCDNFNILMLKMYYVWQLFLCFNMNSEMINRLAMYISISSVFVYPTILRYVHNRYGKKCLWIAWLFIILSIGFVFLRALLRNIYDIIPYVSIFN